MNPHTRQEWNQLVSDISEVVDRVLKAKRCPNCTQIGHEIYSVAQPSGFTGIFNCMNPGCPVSTFDPSMPEVLR